MSSVCAAALLLVTLCSADVPVARQLADAERRRTIDAVSSCRTSRCNGVHYDLKLKSDIRLSECTTEKVEMKSVTGDVWGKGTPFGDYFCKETCKYCLRDDVWGKGTHYGRLDFIRKSGLLISSPHCERLEEEAHVPVARPLAVSHDAALAMFNPFGACKAPKCAGVHYSLMVHADITLSECTIEKGKMKNGAGKELSTSDVIGYGLDEGNYFCQETCKYSIGDEEWGKGSFYGRIDFIRTGGLFISSPHCERFEEASSEATVVV